MSGEASRAAALVVLISTFVFAAAVTFERAVRDGDVSWSGLLGMMAAGLVGWALLAQRFVLR